MEPLRYLDFELKIEREGDHYTARVIRSPAGEASCDFTLPFTEDRLKLLVLTLGHLRGSTRRIHSTEMEAARELGGKLFEAVFVGDVRACFSSSLDEAYRKERTGLRLKLRLQEVPLLSDLPWEFLLDATLDRFFAQSNQTPIVRYIEMHGRIEPITVNLPLHLLVIISSPSDCPRLDVERERSRLEEPLEPLIKAGKVRVKWLESPTSTDLLHCLREGEYHVFHFIGHGGFDKKREEGVLVLEDEQGRGGLAGAHWIGTILHDHPSLRLAVLNSCEGARNSRTDPSAGVAAGLIRQGVPAVVAMQFEITDEAAITFTGEFYAALAQGFPVDAAVAEARKAIYIHSDIEWGTPVLYMRTSDGILFDLVQKPATEKKPSPDQEIVQSKHETIPKSKQPVAVTPIELQTVPTVCILDGHMEPVNSVAFSPDGAIIASVAGGGIFWSNDNNVRLWRVLDGGLLRTFEGHTSDVTSVAFSPDGTILAAGSKDNTVRLWRVSDGKSLRTLGAYKLMVKFLRSLDGCDGDSVNSVAFSPDGAVLASGSSGARLFGGPRFWTSYNAVRLWRVSDGKSLHILEGHSSHVASVAFSPDGVILASSSWDNTVRLWRVSDGGLLHILEGHSSPVASVAFSPDGVILASSSWDNTVRLWRVSDGWLLRTLEGHIVVSVAFSPDGKTLASGSLDNTVRLWRVSDGKLLCKLEGHTKMVNSVAFSPDGKTLASGSDDKTVRLWRVK